MQTPIEALDAIEAFSKIWPRLAVGAIANSGSFISINAAVTTPRGMKVDVYGMITDLRALADAEAKIATLARERDEWRESWANRRDLADNLTEKLIEAEAKIETLARERDEAKRYAELLDRDEDEAEEVVRSILGKDPREEDEPVGIVTLVGTLARQLATSQAREERLRAALDACEIVMETAAIHGAGGLLTGGYRDSWATAHANARAALAASPVKEPS